MQQHAPCARARACESDNALIAALIASYRACTSARTMRCAALKHGSSTLPSLPPPPPRSTTPRRAARHPALLPSSDRVRRESRPPLSLIRYTLITARPSPPAPVSVLGITAVRRRHGEISDTSHSVVRPHAAENGGSRRPFWLRPALANVKYAYVLNAGMKTWSTSAERGTMDVGICNGSSR